MYTPKTKFSSLPETFSPQGRVLQPQQYCFENSAFVHALALDFADLERVDVGIRCE